jgi:uncharacterized 2Fe-2S/4Fe-4S cluster protein (DUF4445 family)
MKNKVTFEPYNLTVEVEKGEILLRAALKAGVHINASCGGSGVCGKCRVLLEAGSVECPEATLFSADEWQLGYRQACQCRVISDVLVRIPPESLLDRATITRRRAGLALRPHPIDVPALRAQGLYNPAFQKYFLKLHPANREHNICDLSRLETGLKRQYGLTNLTLDSFLVRKLGRAMREKNFEVTATLDFAQRRSRKPRLVNIEAGDTTDLHYALAVDIGTTTVWVQLLDLAKGEIIGLAADYNGQLSYGDDVITRILHCQKEGGLNTLQKAVVATINNIIKRILKKYSLPVEEVSHLTVAGNTTMTHLFYAIDPQYIRLAPYTPTACHAPPIRAQYLGLEFPEHVFVYSVSSVSSYVGGDIVSGVLASGIYKEPKMTLYIDIGANGVIVIGNRDMLVCAACSAGPAFEGGGILFGMRAAKGAVEEVQINPQTAEPMLLTIGLVKPKGICGSGLINLMAALMETGLLLPNGKFRHDLATPRLREGNSGWEYVLAWGAETASGEDLTLSEMDIDNLLRAKGAMFAGFLSVLDSVGLGLQDVEQVILAGAFGSFIDLDNAITIGLLPDLPRESFQFVGNASLMGTTFLAFSRDLLEEERRVAGMMTNLELSEIPGYMDQYLAALFLPHTQEKYFPTVTERLRGVRG